MAKKRPSEVFTIRRRGKGYFVGYTGINTPIFGGKRKDATRFDGRVEAVTEMRCWPTYAVLDSTVVEM